MGAGTPGDLNAGNINFSIRNIKCNMVGCENIPLHTDVCIWIQKPQSKWQDGTKELMHRQILHLP